MKDHCSAIIPAKPQGWLCLTGKVTAKSGIRYLIFLQTVFFSLFVFSANAQSFIPINADSLNTKIDNYNKLKSEGKLFVHFDKNIYSTNENAWFTAYFLNDIYNEKQSFISVVLIDNRNVIKIQEKFIMLDGVSSGKILLPDSLNDGTYNFMVYYGNATKGKPITVFVQPVTIKKPSAAFFKASFMPVESTAPATERVENVQLILSSKKENLVADLPVYYYIGDPVSPVFSGKIKTNKIGQCQVSVPFKYLTNDHHILQLVVTYKNENRYLKYTFPGFSNSIAAKFYPEGGSLAEGLPNNVGWEVKDKAGAPIKLAGVVYKNGQPMDTIKTNNYGVGRFNFTPESKNRYFVRLLYPDSQNTDYELPVISTGSPAIIISNAIADDTLSVIVRSKKPTSFYGLVHNYKQVFFSFSLRADAAGRPVKIALTDLPKGIAEITLLDSLKRPCAERLFFAHYGLNDKLSINTNKSSYQVREKVLLDIQLKGHDGKPVTGLVSIACVQANRVSADNFKTIDSYLYLINELGRLPFKRNYLGDSMVDRNFLEDILLIKGWRKYFWKGLNEVNLAGDSLVNQDTAILAGEVFRMNKSLKKPVSVIVIKDGSLSEVKTSAAGKFSLSADDLQVTDGKKVRLFVTGTHPEEYRIKITDALQNLIDSLSPALNNSNTIIQSRDYSAQPDQIQFGGTVTLDEVKIRSRRDNSFFGSPARQNPCGDYVCLYGFLNCPLHIGDAGNQSPVKGKTYKSYIGADGSGQEIYTQTVYVGCEVKKYDYAKVINGILYPVEFYAADYEKDTLPDPQFISTIYWKNIYQLPSPSGKPLEFYTSDITGEFKIIVQGVTDDDLIYGQQSFRVSEK